MCIMASPVRSVSDTRIFVGADAASTRQATVYEMSVALQSRTGKGNAMILPVPIGTGTIDQIELIDLTGAPEFFEPLEEVCRERSRGISKGLSRGFDDDLEVVKVGNYDVSVVPTVNDVKRLNAAVFDVSPDTEATLRAHYPLGFAFLVAQLRESGKFHPLAYTAPLVGDRLFIPTRHEHGRGAAGGPAAWDHQIFYQGSARPDSLPSHERNTASAHSVQAGEWTDASVRTASRGVPAALTPFLRPGLALTRVKAQGPLANIDLTVPVT